MIIIYTVTEHCDFAIPIMYHYLILTNWNENQKKKKPVEKHARWLPRYTLSTTIRSPMLFTFFSSSSACLSWSKHWPYSVETLATLVCYYVHNGWVSNDVQPKRNRAENTMTLTYVYQVYERHFFLFIFLFIFIIAWNIKFKWIIQNRLITMTSNWLDSNLHGSGPLCRWKEPQNEENKKTI